MNFLGASFLTPLPVSTFSPFAWGNTLLRKYLWRGFKLSDLSVKVESGVSENEEYCYY